MQKLKAQLLKKARRVVIKIGTHVLTGDQGSLDEKRIAHLVDQMHALSAGHKKEFIIVTSGAVGAGMGRLGIHSRPKALPDIQALAAIGQSLVIETYRRAWNRHGKEIGQLLLTREDFQNRNRYLNMTNTLNALLRLGIIPIINENDTVATDEITFGDNDQLCSLVSHTVHADLVVLLTNTDGLLDGKNGQVIPFVAAIDREILSHVQDSRSRWGIGGMQSKLKAVQQIINTGEPVIMANGRREGVLTDLFAGQELGTLFKPGDVKLKSKKRWIAFFAKPSGDVIIDTGARDALVKKNSSLLAIGIKDVAGRFQRGAIVRILAGKKEIARGLVNYSAETLLKIKGLKSNEIPAILGNEVYGEVIHKDNLVILDETVDTASP